MHLLVRPPTRSAKRAWQYLNPSRDRLTHTAWVECVATATNKSAPEGAPLTPTTFVAERWRPADGANSDSPPGGRGHAYCWNANTHIHPGMRTHTSIRPTNRLDQHFVALLYILLSGRQALVGGAKRGEALSQGVTTGEDLLAAARDLRSMRCVSHAGNTPSNIHTNASCAHRDRGSLAR